MLLDRDAHPVQQLAGTRLGSVAAEFGIARLQIGRMHIVLFACVRIGINGVALGHGLPHLLVPHQHHVEHALVFVGKLVLAQLAHALAAVHRDAACARLQVAAEDFHECGFAATIGADQAIAVALAELDRYVVEQGLGAELNADAGGDDQGVSVSGVGAKEAAFYRKQRPAIRLIQSPVNRWISLRSFLVGRPFTPAAGCGWVLRCAICA